jgi:DNA-binding CsgD family transcriptional regulator
VHDPSLGENRALLDAACTAVGLALENEHLRGTALAPASAPGDPAEREREVQALIDVGLEAQAVRSVPDLVEAYVRSGRAGEAETLLGSFETEIANADDPRARAAAARCRGLLADDFDVHFQEALREHERVPAPFERARTELCYGERLRRARRRVEARERLRSALAVFEAMGVEDWTERARAELAATGEHIRRRDPAAGEELTPQEAQVALLVARGATNREVGAALFLSPKTIEAHLGRIYRKLGVRSRTELAHLLASESGNVPALPERQEVPAPSRAPVS